MPDLTENASPVLTFETFFSIITAAPITIAPTLLGFDMRFLASVFFAATLAAIAVAANSIAPEDRKRAIEELTKEAARVPALKILQKELVAKLGKKKDEQLERRIRNIRTELAELANVKKAEGFAQPLTLT